MIRFETSKEESDLLMKVTDRAWAVLHDRDFHWEGLNKLDLLMSLTACHLNGCPLKLEELLEASEADLLHDMTGIHAKINKTTGKLMDHFWPRYAKPAEQK